jgi:hypothetical protein
MLWNRFAIVKNIFRYFLMANTDVQNVGSGGIVNKLFHNGMQLNAVRIINKKLYKNGQSNIRRLGKNI